MKRILLLFVMAISGLIAYSQTPTKTETMADFQATDNFGNNCYYKITDAAKHYVQLWGKEKRVPKSTQPKLHFSTCTSADFSKIP